MGWLYVTSRKTKKSLAEFILNDYSTAGTILGHSLRGNVLYIAFEGKDKKRHILIELIQYNRHSDCYGYKSMDAPMGPYYFDCPLKYLDMVPCSGSEYEVKWRETVRKQHAKNSRKLEVGETYSIPGYKEFNSGKILNLKPLVLLTNSGKRYRFSKKQLEEKLS